MAPRIKKFQVTLRLVDDEWQGTTTYEGEKFVSRGLDTRGARIRLRNQLVARFGDNCELMLTIEHPPELAQRIENVHAMRKQLEELSHLLPQLTLETAKELIGKGHYTQTDAAEALGLTQSNLAMIMGRDAADLPMTKTSTKRRTT